MPEDQPVPSPRTPDEPMAFTRDELLSGAFRTWSLFVALVCAGFFLVFALQVWGASAWDSLLALAFIIGYAALIAGGVAAFATAIAVPAVYALGRILRHEGRMWIHTLIYIGFGLAVGLLAFFVGDAISGGYPMLSYMAGTCAAVAVPVGWRLTVRASLRADRGDVRRRRIRVDQDMAAEDALN
jgi:hypothetical protein